MDRIIRKLKYFLYYFIVYRSKLFDKKYYLINNPDVRKLDLDPIEHYLKFGGAEGRNPSEFFDSLTYLLENPDVQEACINPLVHFILYGQRERRIVSQSISLQDDKLPFLTYGGIFKNKNILGLGLNLQKGSLSYNSEKEVIVFVSHESSATGAPLLGYNIVEGLNSSYNVVHIVIRKSSISDVIPQNCFLYVDDISLDPAQKSENILNYLHEKYTVKAVIVNSIEAIPALHAASKLMLPCITLIHEFSENTRPRGKMATALFHSTEVVTPSPIVTKSILRELNELSGIVTRPSHITEIPQGKLPILPGHHGYETSLEDICDILNISDLGSTKIILGSGYVHIRKGVDRFLNIARYIRSEYNGNCKFVWVGDGFEPELDMNYSLWLARDLETLGLSEDFIFLKHQKNLDLLYSITDVFCLTSRLDPFPNVVIDALDKNLMIACFRDASGSVDFLESNNIDFIVADYLDDYGLALNIVEYLNIPEAQIIDNSDLVKSKLNFENYVSELDQVINRAVSKNQKNISSAYNVLEANMLDVDYYGLASNSDLAAYYYASLFYKGLHRMSPNPKPGFSQLKAIASFGFDNNNVPAEKAFAVGADVTHECILIPYQVGDLCTSNVKYAVHLHLFYADLAEYFCNYFKNLVGSFDLYITITDREEYDYVFHSFEECGAENVEVILVENVGRDIGPLIFGIGHILTSNKYEFIGHFHSKKSLSNDSRLGSLWLDYLMENLCGPDGVAGCVINLFDDPSVGLIFADDKHIVDIGSNREYIDKLSEMLSLGHIEDTTVFPLGNMFWARVEAIRPLFDLDPNIILQAEPLPYDGSFMHAIERITPDIVIENGFRWVTVYRPGTSW